MAIAVLNRESKYLIRPAPTDHLLLDRLLTPDLFAEPIRPDGLIFEAPHIEAV